MLRRAFSPAWLYPLGRPEDALVIAHPQLGYALRPAAAEQWTRAHWSFAIAISADGLRDARLRVARAASLRALAVGDSFTFGLASSRIKRGPRCSSTSWRSGSAERTAVVNAGVPGLQRAPDALACARSARAGRSGAGRRGALRAQLLAREGAVRRLRRRRWWCRRELARLAIAASGDLVVTPFRPGVLRDVDIWLKGHLHLPARIFDAIGTGSGRSGRSRTTSPDRSQWTDRDYQPVLDELAQLHAALAARGIPMVLLLVEPSGRRRQLLARRVSLQRARGALLPRARSADRGSVGALRRGGAGQADLPNPVRHALDAAGPPDRGPGDHASDRGATPPPAPRSGRELRTLRE